MTRCTPTSDRRDECAARRPRTGAARRRARADDPGQAARAGARLEIGGLCAQVEDEIAFIAVLLGAAWRGGTTMTATSGPGLSLMLEPLGLGTGAPVPEAVAGAPPRHLVELLHDALA